MKWIVRFVGLVLLIVVLVGVGVLMLPADRIARIASDQLTRATGRTVSITGDVGMTFWPVLGVRVEGLDVGNADWAKESAMLSSAQAAIGVDAGALLRGDIRITHIEAQSPVIRLESRADGRASWIFTDGTGAAEVATERDADAEAANITIERLRVTDATVIYDAEGADLVSFEGVDLALDWPDPTDTAEIRATLRPAGQDVTVDASIAAFAAFLAGEVQDVSAQVAAAQGQISLTGRAALEGAVAGALKVSLPNTSAFTSALGAGTAALPKGLGQSVSLSTDLTLTTDRQLSLRDLVADLGGNTLRGALDVGLNGTPQITARLDAGDLDLRVLTGAGEETPPASEAQGWPKAAIDASGLAAFNGTIALTAQSVDLGALRLGRTDTQLVNDRSRMVFTLREVAAYEGVLRGEFVMNNRNGLSVGGKLRAESVEMKTLLTDLAGLSRFSGKGNAELSFLGVGQSVDAIMRSLSGTGALDVGRGAIEGIDLDNLLGSFDTKGGTTVFDSLSASFEMAAGVLRNEDLTMLLPNFETTGAGEVNLGAQTIDYTVTPKALRVNQGRGLAVPVQIVGPWAAPSIRPDAKAALDLNFQAEKERAEERVKQEVAEKLEEELGVVREDGQSLEDAVKDKAEDKLKRELLRLFD